MAELPLLQSDEPPPLERLGADARSPFVLVCDHAGRRLPRSLGSLGLSEADLAAHIAWDIGAAGLARRLADALDASLFLQRYSRLVIDCNRPLSAPDSIAQKSGGVPIPGNQGLSLAAAEERARSIFWPYHQAIRAELDARQARGEGFVLVSVHSFTPVLYGTARPFHTGILYEKDTRLAHPLLELLRREPGLVVGDNEPYRASAATDYAIIEYGERRAQPYVEIEVRQDLISDAAGESEWAERFARLLRRVTAAFSS
ncbi:MAG TPA: N-formylglutamate amidohydrolase [Polyangiaceae bacterium]|nr:N-formylglutamate amidohydrolase [Polyangiaceae bacterium]